MMTIEYNSLGYTIIIQFSLKNKRTNSIPVEKIKLKDEIYFL